MIQYLANINWEVIPLLPVKEFVLTVLCPSVLTVANQTQLQV